MKIGIASDHRGIFLKARLIEYLEHQGHKVVDYGTDLVDSADFPKYAFKLGKGILKKEVTYGIAICGTGIGMSIAANKISGIIAAKVNSPREAKLCKEHNMANVMTLAEYTENLEEILDNFIYTIPSTEERHIRRLNKINHLE